MTVDVPTAVLVGGAISAVAAMGAWAARTTIFDRLSKLEEKHDQSAGRFGEGDHVLDKRVTVLEERNKWTTKT